MKVLGHGLAFVLLTILTQVGGVVWLISRLFRRPLLVVLPLYLAVSGALFFAAPLWGRVPVSCFANGPLVLATPLYCALNRTFVTPELHAALQDLARDMDARHPGTKTLMLDGNFPLFDGFPLLPHLSHDDGRKADLAFYYRDAQRYLPGVTRSPLGYFAFQPGVSDCPKAWPSLRWDLNWAQPMMRDLMLDVPRMQAAIELLSADARIGKIFVEPHLRKALRATHPKVRFQGCRAARHDDHLHIQL